MELILVAISTYFVTRHETCRFSVSVLRMLIFKLAKVQTNALRFMQTNNVGGTKQWCAKYRKESCLLLVFPRHIASTTSRFALQMPYVNSILCIHSVLTELRTLINKQRTGLTGLSEGSCVRCTTIATSPAYQRERH